VDSALPQNEEWSFNSVKPRTLPEIVAEKIVDAILAGQLRPGERLVEQKLSAQFGIGQPTLRAALQNLEHQGFTRKNGNRGTYVTQFTEDNVRKNLEVRVVLEALAVEKAAQNITAADERELRETIHQMEESAKRFDRSGFHKADVVFHQKLWRLSHNPYLESALSGVIFSLFAFMLVDRKPLDEVLTHVARQHSDILDGVLTRDPQIARKSFLKTTLGFWRDYHGVDPRSESIR
jgi:DNA-binding GntR family transcriptional regulator